ncbi:MAG: mechanosensitive ion channel family protein [Anaerolineae bacterium]
MPATLDWMGFAALSPWMQGVVVVAFSAVTFVVARYFLARGLTYIARRTRNKVDDIIVQHLHPFRFAWIAPLVVLHYFADLLPSGALAIRQILLFLILWLALVTGNALLNAINEIYERSSYYRGQPIQSYLDLLKLVMIAVGIILSISLFTGQSPLVLLSGLGAVMAVLLLLFQDTLLSLVASLQIHSNDLVKEGDWIEMPAYDADGDVLNISLHSVKVQNWDKTITTVPTHKLLNTPYRNWRGMQESGGRRIKRAIHLDLNTVRFCDGEMIDRYREVALVKDYVEGRLADVVDWAETHEAEACSPFAAPELTNLGVFRAYVTSYLQCRPDLHREGMPLLVRELDPGPSGLPLEVYAFTKTTEWEAYEGIQADIFEHLVAAAPQFDLRVFQQPTGVDFRALIGPQPTLEGPGVDS